MKKLKKLDGTDVTLNDEQHEMCSIVHEISDEEYFWKETNMELAN